MHITKIPMHLHQKTKRNLKYRKPVRELLRKTTSGWPFLCYLTMTGKLVGDCRIQWLGVFVLRSTLQVATILVAMAPKILELAT